MNKGITEVKISMPLIDDIELQRIDNYYNDIVKEYTKAFLKEKEQVIAQRIMMNLQQENQELKNQQKEFIKWLEHELDISGTNASRYYYFLIVLSKYNEIIGAK